MPPHCDSLDGPVVTAARQALEAGDVDLVLPFVPEHGEAEVRAMFDTVLPVRDLNEDARDVADRLFFETVVRVHRAGEGAPYAGLKPAGLSQGPVIPLAERAIETGSPNPVADFLTGVLQDELKHRLEQVNTLTATKDRSVQDGRRYVEAMLGFEVYSHHLLQGRCKRQLTESIEMLTTSTATLSRCTSRTIRRQVAVEPLRLAGLRPHGRRPAPGWPMPTPT